MKSKTCQILILLLLLPMAQCSMGQRNSIELNTREAGSGEGDTLVNGKPAFAGSFYSGTRDALHKQLSGLFEGMFANLF